MASLRRYLLRWYDTHHRDLPWRASPRVTAGDSGRRPPVDPYRVLVSETMLQQTQVATVIPYFERFIAAFPTVAALASADEQQVLRMWQGLGYYRRARNLHAAAKLIVQRFAGHTPHAVADLLQLPGVGRYTAGAIASIAHGQPAAIVDGNVARVLSRWFALEESPDSTAGRRRLWELAEKLVDVDRPGDFNQAMMELGALVCIPREPACPRCPVAHRCEARKRGLERALPNLSPRKSRTPVTHIIIAMRKPDGRFLFERRPERGLWSNMWQLVTREEARQPEGPGVAADLPEWVRQRYGLIVDAPRPAGGFLHVTTHRDITFEVMRCDVLGGRLRSGMGAWRPLHKVDDLPLARPQQRAMRIIGEAGRSASVSGRPAAGG